MTELIDKLEAELKTEILTLISGGHLPHAIILEGKDNEALDIVTDILTQYAVCLSDKDKPCGVCNGCFKGYKHIHPDVYSLTGSGTGGKIRVNDIRELCADTLTMPNEAPCKVYVINNSHLMNEQAQNALLKSLEEPGQATLFILRCENPASLLSTIRSRCVLIKTSFESSMQRSEEIEKAHRTAVEIINALCGKSEVTLLKSLSTFGNDREMAYSVISRIKVLLIAALSGKYDSEDSIICLKLRNTLNSKKIFKAINIAQKAENAVRHNANMNLLSVWMSAYLRELRSN